METSLINELLKITKENNEMLKKIVSHIENINEDEYKTKHLL